MHTTHPYTAQSDEALLARYRDTGDSMVLGYLLQRYTTLLLGVGLKYLKDKTQAEDAVQQVFLKALTHLPQGEILNFKGWLYILMRNHCLQQLRDKAYTADEGALANRADAGAAAKEETEWKDHTLEQMEAAIDLLNEAQRKCILLFYMQKQSYEQIMGATGYTFTQVKSHIQNGKRNLKIILMKRLANGRNE